MSNLFKEIKQIRGDENGSTNTYTVFVNKKKEDQWVMVYHASMGYIVTSVSIELVRDHNLRDCYKSKAQIHKHLNELYI